MENIACRFFCDIKIYLLFRYRIRFAIGKDQERVVIQHFFKMRNKELFVGGVSTKSKSDVVKHSAAIHLQEGMLRHVQTRGVFVTLIIIEQKQQIVRCREFWSPPEAAVFFVIDTLETPRHVALTVISAVPVFVGLNTPFSTTPTSPATE